MKDVGYTDTGNRLVELSREEYDEFARLAQCVEGRVQVSLEYRENRFYSGFDFTKTFEVIRAFYTSKFQINQFQGLIDEMKRSLEKVGGV